ncbi:MAG: hypothetical protein NZ895_01355 [Archaeoglobaceae archaeon]|nr:hypothetical protein [Archaeoglobaceae archaeon]MCX8151670.1 hypothetical protein [Archaeoglobaceae archaeon]MDW8013052.1 hypothetical protein [Archaeoglobaceae archaeon]
MYISQLSSLTNSTYNYVFRLIKILEENCLVETKIEGRTRTIFLTEEGRKIAEILDQLVRELNKDLKGRHRLRILEKLAEDGKGFRQLAGILAELEILRKSYDEEVREKAEKLLKKVREKI